jgi:hypothetical protein
VLRYPYQAQMAKSNEAANNSLYTMPHDLFYQLHPFHLILNPSLEIVQIGSALKTVAPRIRLGDPLALHFKVSLTRW